MHDEQATVSQLRAVVAEFVRQRDWQQFHAPKNLAMALAIEAAELMEHFQWISVGESRQIAPGSEKMVQVGEELADVLCYTLAMANELGIDLAAAMADKMVKNARKYPANEYRGRYGPEDPGPAGKST